MGLKRLANNVISAIPVISDAKDHYWSFYRNRTAIRGVFDDFDQARRSIPANAIVGYDQPEVAADANFSEVTASKRLGELDPKDYPILFWLKSTLDAASSVFDIGGNVGVEYFSYLKHLPEIANLKWTVCELPHTVEAGRRLAQARKAGNLMFTEDVNDGDGCSTLLCTGTMQYLPYDLDKAIAAWKIRPATIIIGNTPAWDGRQFVTVQNVGYAFVPYRVFSKADLRASFADAGYRQVDEWKFPHHLSVPFSRSFALDYYCGFVFRRD